MEVVLPRYLLQSIVRAQSEMSGRRAQLKDRRQDTVRWSRYLEAIGEGGKAGCQGVKLGHRQSLRRSVSSPPALPLGLPHLLKNHNSDSIGSTVAGIQCMDLI